MSLFKKKQRGDTTIGGPDSKWEEVLNESFSLTFLGDEGWRYEGNFLQEFATGLSDPMACLQTFKSVQAQMPFKRVCLLSGRPPIVVCDTTPPSAVETGLDTEGAARFIFAIASGGGKQLYDYKGAWLLEFPMGPMRVAVAGEA